MFLEGCSTQILPFVQAFAIFWSRHLEKNVLFWFFSSKIGTFQNSLTKPQIKTNTTTRANESQEFCEIFLSPENNLCCHLLVSKCTTDELSKAKKRPCHLRLTVAQHMVKSPGKDLSFSSRLESLEDSRKKISTFQFY